MCFLEFLVKQGVIKCDQDSGYPSNIFFKSKTKVTCPAKLTDGVVIS
jgi:hypothetical protein